jgi:hypothetical protein
VTELNQCIDDLARKNEILIETKVALEKKIHDAEMINLRLRDNSMKELDYKDQQISYVQKILKDLGVEPNHFPPASWH